MSIAGALRLPEPPDLLRRFVPTPFMVRGQMDGISFCIWTNDARYLRLRGKVVGKVVLYEPARPLVDKSSKEGEGFLSNMKV